MLWIQIRDESHVQFFNEITRIAAGAMEVVQCSLQMAYYFCQQGQNHMGRSGAMN
uniref:Uncharacterized protein n=1 Tax=Arion vulgaris TaxID=1028688 RepID=A0A0B7AW30_9EUPU